MEIKLNLNTVSEYRLFAGFLVQCAALAGAPVPTGLGNPPAPTPEPVTIDVTPEPVVMPKAPIVDGPPTSVAQAAQAAAEKPKRAPAKKAAPAAAPAPTPVAEAAQDAADEAEEAAEVEPAKEAREYTGDDVRKALSAYMNKYGMAAAQEDCPAILKGAFGNDVTKVSAIPPSSSNYEQAMLLIMEASSKNMFNRTVEAGK